MANRQYTISEGKEISISEFFEKNRHILGFDSPQKALYMVVKEALDNSLDACEEHQIMPDIRVKVSKIDGDEFQITIEDNGPGIERKEVPKVFGQLLYGSRFHSFKQSRGQQGIGITAAVLYGQITTGKETYVKTKIAGSEVAYEFSLGINVKENRAKISSEKPVMWDTAHGTIVSVHSRGKYQVGKQSIFEYLKETATVNPNMNLIFEDPDNKVFQFRRIIEKPSVQAKAIKPYPIGLEPGEIVAMARESSATSMLSFLSGEFSRISRNTAEEICRLSGIDPESKPATIGLNEVKALRSSLSTVKILPPSQDCLSPLGEEFIRKGLMNIYDDLHPAFYSRPVSRPVSTYNGNPVSVEVGLVYGGDLPQDEAVRIVRYSNKVPLLYQPGACATTKAVTEIDWRSYGLDQRSGTGLPFGPMILFIHVFGIRVPYTSESKEAIAPVTEISEEIKAALKTSARSIRSFLNKRERRKKISEKFRLVSTIIPEISQKSAQISGQSEIEIDEVLSKVANVIFITESVDSQENGVKVTVSIHNYTAQPRSFKLIADPPIGDSTPNPAEFEISGLKPAAKIDFSFDVKVEPSRYPGTDYYFTGIDSIYMNGAEPLPADWGVEKVQVEEISDGE